MYWINLVWACRRHLPGTVFLKKAKHTFPSPANRGRK